MDTVPDVLGHLRLLRLPSPRPCVHARRRSSLCRRFAGDVTRRQHSSRVQRGRAQEHWFSSHDHAAFLEQAAVQRRESASPGGAGASESDSDMSDDDSNGDDDFGDGVFDRLGPMIENDDC